MSALYSELGRRERQIMDVLFRHGRATAAEVLQEIPDPPSYSSVRSMLRLLEQKGYVRHKWAGPRYVFVPTGRRDEAQRFAARHMLSTFFNDSMESAVSAMLGAAETPPSAEELDRLARLIERAKRKGGRP